MLPRFAHPAVQLGVFRVATYLTLLAIVDPRITAHYAAYPAVLAEPPGFWKHLVSAPWITPWSPWLAYAIFVPACVASILGVRARPAQFVAILAGGYLLSVAQFFGKVNHFNHVLWFALILLLSPCADAIAIDARRTPPSRSRSPLAPPSLRPPIFYELPLRFAWILLGLAYFFPGFWKIVSVGPSWADAANIEGILFAKWAEVGRVSWLRVDAWSYREWKWACGVIGWSTLAFELLFIPISLLGRRARAILVAFGILFHVGIWLAMDIRIGHIAIGYLALVDVSPWVERFCAAWRARADSRARAASSARWPMWPVTTLGIALVLGNLYDGIARRDDWPLGMYPAFAWHAPRVHVTVEIIAEWNDGTRRALTPLDLAHSTTPERAASTHLQALASEPLRTQRQHALWHVWTTLDPTLRTASSVRFERVARLVDPAQRQTETDRQVVGGWELSRE